MNAADPVRVALLYPGDRAMRDRADPSESRFAALFNAFAAAGVQAEPAVWNEDFAPEVEAQLAQVKTVLVWCNPIEAGRRREPLDEMLRRVAALGVRVSTHPDTILRLGTKDVLLATRELPFGSDVHRVDSLAQLAVELPERLQRGARVLKQHRGHSGIGVWKVERIDEQTLGVQHAARGSSPEQLDMATLCELLAPFFAESAGGHMIDQAWQPGIARGMVRLYLVQDRVVGFGAQAVNALHPEEPAPGPRLYHDRAWPPGQALAQKMEDQWITQLRDSLGLLPGQLPLLWDCDFIHGEGDTHGDDRFVLCEVNVSSVSPFPPSAIAPLVEATKAGLPVIA